MTDQSSVLSGDYEKWRAGYDDHETAARVIYRISMIQYYKLQRIKFLLERCEKGEPVDTILDIIEE